jgi:hypothetical protein
MMEMGLSRVAGMFEGALTLIFRISLQHFKTAYYPIPSTCRKIERSTTFHCLDESRKLKSTLLIKWKKVILQMDALE